MNANVTERRLCPLYTRRKIDLFFISNIGFNKTGGIWFFSQSTIFSF